MPRTEKPTWFLLKSTDYQPGGYLTLGRILKSYDPGDILNPGLLPKVASKIDSVPKKVVTEAFVSGQSVMVGLFVKFLEVTGLGGEAGFGFGKSDAVKYNIEKLETHHFIPEADFVKECLKSPDVQDYITGGWIKKNIYMISGVKIAIGAQMERIDSSQQDVHLRGGVNTSATCVPIDLGLAGTASSSSQQIRSFRDSAGFVYAFRLRQVYYSKDKVRTEPVAGQFYNVHGSEQDLDDDDDDEPEEVAAFWGLGEGDVNIELEFGLQPSETVRDGNEECNYVIV
ncbi:uncharacterized protein K441DRAFT_653304 [Cenococcum geophilum 1.58]|uniref:uncharacterized protein n=1 Tax=Cenococcum geophilum 1.58 TaxID=794803 RepID=UPI003590276C|nr:hypothetical protein K441DRAFT_653304 [Cenococcum geophilum 1.58]